MVQKNIVGLIAPTPFISSINNRGKVFIQFSSEVVVVGNLTSINNGTIFKDEVPIARKLRRRDKINPKDLRQLATERPSVPVMELKMVPGLESNASLLTFIWNVTKEDSLSMEI